MRAPLPLPFYRASRVGRQKHGDSERLDRFTGLVQGSMGTAPETVLARITQWEEKTRGSRPAAGAQEKRPAPLSRPFVAGDALGR